MTAVNQTSATPTTKVQAATALAAFTSILSWADDRFLGDYVPGYIEAALITIGVFAAGYFVKNRSTDAPPATGVPDGGYGAIGLVVAGFVVALLVWLISALI